MSHPPTDSPFVSPAMTCLLSGRSPFVIRNLILGDPQLGSPRRVRTAHIGGRLVVHIGDVLALAVAERDGPRNPAAVGGRDPR